VHASARETRDGIGAIVLAAGLGRRFGGAKLLAPFRGRPLLSYSCEAVRSARESGLLAAAWGVVAADDQAARSLIERAGLGPVTNIRTAEGISHSIRLGLDAAASEPALGAVLLLLGDQPLIQVSTMRHLVQAWLDRSGPAIRPRYAEQPDAPGHPVLLDRTLWPLAQRATGDHGLADLLPPPVLIDVPGGNPDIDTRPDLHRLQEPPR
jgi:molybdenum cofactor cytidylyltransferase